MRERLNALLARQHELGLRRSKAARDEFITISVEVLRLARYGVINLEPDWKPPPTITSPLPVRKNIETVQDLSEAKQRLVSIKQRGGAGWMDEYRDLENQIRSVEGIILEKAQRSAA